MRNNKMKKCQSQFRKILRKMNKQMITDPEWKGRYEIRQRNAEWTIFEDNSGLIMYPTIRIYDKETNTAQDYWLSYSSWSTHKVWLALNDFIIHSEKRDIAEMKDYRKIKYDQSIWNQKDIPLKRVD